MEETKENTEAPPNDETEGQPSNMKAEEPAPKMEAEDNVPQQKVEETLLEEGEISLMGESKENTEAPPNDETEGQPSNMMKAEEPAPKMEAEDNVPLQNVEETLPEEEGTETSPPMKESKEPRPTKKEVSLPTKMEAKEGAGATASSGERPERSDLKTDPAKTPKKSKKRSESKTRSKSKTKSKSKSKTKERSRGDAITTPGKVEEPQSNAIAPPEDLRTGSRTGHVDDITASRMQEETASRAISSSAGSSRKRKSSKKERSASLPPKAGLSPRYKASGKKERSASCSDEIDSPQGRKTGHVHTITTAGTTIEDCTPLEIEPPAELPLDVQVISVYGINMRLLPSALASGEIVSISAKESTVVVSLRSFSGPLQIVVDEPARGDESLMTPDDFIDDGSEITEVLNNTVSHHSTLDLTLPTPDSPQYEQSNQRRRSSFLPLMGSHQHDSSPRRRHRRKQKRESLFFPSVGVIDEDDAHDLVDIETASFPESPESNKKRSDVSPSSSQDGMQSESRVDEDKSEVIPSKSLNDIGRWTQLHEICASEDATLQEMIRILKLQPADARVFDEDGRLPLHILSENAERMETRKGRDILQEFWLELARAYPEAIVTHDCLSYVPFTALISQWVQITHLGAPQIPAQGGANSQSLTIQSLMAQFMQSDKAEPIPQNLSASKTSDSSERSFPEVDVSSADEFCFTMLSAGFDFINGKKSKKPPRQQALARGAILADSIAQIPLLVKTILLIQEDEVREHILGLPILRRVLFSPSTVGPWLVHMMGRSGLPSQRSIDYLEAISSLTVDDLIGHIRTARRRDEESFVTKRELIFDLVEDQNFIGPSLLLLKDKEIELAAATEVIWRIMSRALTKPFIVAITITTLAIHFAMIQAFRERLNSNHANSIFAPSTTFFSFVLAHFVCRKIIDVISLGSISKRMLWSYLFDAWNIIDTISVILLISVVPYLDELYTHVDLKVASFGFLWLKLFGFLRTLNVHLSVFLMSIQYIVSHMVTLCVIITLAVFMFGDMMQVATVLADSGNVCSNPDIDIVSQDFCSSSVGSSYLRVYTVLLGDFNLHTWRDTELVTALWVGFTLLGFIVLLNVLIAVVAESYERSKRNHGRLFGRARTKFVTAHISFERFASLSWMSCNQVKHTLSRSNWSSTGFISLLRFLVVLGFFITAIGAEWFLLESVLTLSISGSGFVVWVLSITVGVFLVAAFLLSCKAVLEQILAPQIQKHSTLRRAFSNFDLAEDRFAKFASRYVLGVRGDRAHDYQSLEYR